MRDPLKTKLKLFLDWGITFDNEYVVEDRGNRKVCYASKRDLEYAIAKKDSKKAIKEQMKNKYKE